MGAEESKEATGAADEAPPEPAAEEEPAVPPAAPPPAAVAAKKPQHDMRGWVSYLSECPTAGSPAAEPPRFDPLKKASTFDGRASDQRFGAAPSLARRQTIATGNPATHAAFVLPSSVLHRKYFNQTPLHKMPSLRGMRVLSSDVG